MMGEIKMPVSYDKLWKTLIDKKMKRSDLKDAAGISFIGQRLNIVDLFERDISELTPDQHACVLEIAKTSPADYFAIAETYGSDMVQALINARVVIRRASKLTLYWDIFRDYVLNHVTPELLLDYIPQLQFGSDICLFSENLSIQL